MNTEELLYGEGTCGSNCAYAFDRNTGTLTIRVEGAMPDYDGGNVGWMNFKEIVKALDVREDCTAIGTNSFLSFENLTSIKLPTSLKKIGNYAFRYCTAISTLSLPANLQEIGDGVFQGCNNLSLFSLPDTLTKIGANAFEKIASESKVSSTVNITIPSSVTSIGSYAFMSIDRLSSVTFNCKLSALTGTSIFTSCKILNDVKIPNFETDGDTTSLSVLMEKGVSAGTNFTAGKLKGTLSSPLNIADMTYDGGAVVGTISGSTPSPSNLPVSLNINPTQVTEVRIPLGTSKIGKNVFNGCSSITSVQNLESVTQIGEGAFSNCTGLTNLTVPSTITSIGSNAFKNVPHISYSGSATGKPWGATACN